MKREVRNLCSERMELKLVEIFLENTVDFIRLDD